MILRVVIIVANDLIFEIATRVHEKEIAVAKSDSVFFTQTNKQVNKNIKVFVSRFEKTKLTSEE